jgi:hypothetical protein
MKKVAAVKPFPIETILSVMFKFPLDHRGTKMILKMLSFVLCEKITLEEMDIAIDYCAPILQGRFPRYYSNPKSQQFIETYKRDIARIKGSRANNKDVRIKRAQKSLALRFGQSYAKTGTVMNRPFVEARSAWHQFKKSA